MRIAQIEVRVIHVIEDVLGPEAVARFLKELHGAPWTDGRVTAGYQSALAKNNRQLPEDCAAALRLGAEIVEALERNLIFQAAALPAEIFPPLFNRYEGGQVFETHVDSAIRPNKRDGRRIRTDLSATLFLSDPASYDGGELEIEDTYGQQSIKLPAGHMVLYPATSLHRVAPTTRGVRIASFFWIQSLVADDGRRAILFDIDISIQRLRQDVGDRHAALIALTGAYHNLVRQWAVP
jgi:PKHD-type hydroxylase